MPFWDYWMQFVPGTLGLLWLFFFVWYLQRR
jgi:hypothetical protein